MSKVGRIGILTGGGDCPGLNAVIRAVTKTALFHHNIEVVGICDGFHGLLHNLYRPLTADDTSGILTQGGTILGASNRDDPFKVLVGKDADGKARYEDHSDRVVANVQAQKLDALVCIGGDGTMAISHRLMTKGIPIVGVPKTIDNDLPATDQTFGFDTASAIVADAVDRLHTTAQAHKRVLVVETMGRYAGWIALAGGMAGGADVILIPEIPYSIEGVMAAIEKRSRIGRRFTIVCVAEGAVMKNGERVVAKHVPDRTDPHLLGGVGQFIANHIEEAQGPECRVVVLGHLQRGGTPTAFDRVLGTRYGVKAAELIAKGAFGRMVALKGTDIKDVSLEEAAGKLRLVSPEGELVQAARGVGTSFGD